MPEARVVFVRTGDVDDPAYRAAVEELFAGDEKYPTVDMSGDRFGKVDDIARRLGLDDSWKVFAFGSQSKAFERFQDSADYRHYRMAHIGAEGTGPST